MTFVCLLAIFLQYDFCLVSVVLYYNVTCVYFLLNFIGLYFILYSETQCISKLDKIGIFIDMKFH